jgi:hypothetical protein
MGEEEGVYERRVGDTKGFGRGRGLVGRIVKRWGLVGMYKGSIATPWDPISTRWRQVM